MEEALLSLVSVDVRNNSDNEAQHKEPTTFVPILLMNKRRRKKKPSRDLATTIPPGVYKSQLQDTSDIVVPFDVAPPTKRAMFLTSYQSVGKYFVNPGRKHPSRALSQQFSRALTLMTEIPKEAEIDADGFLEPLDPELHVTNSEITAYVQESSTDIANSQIQRRKAETFDKLALGMSKSRFKTVKKSRRAAEILQQKENKLARKHPLTPNPVSVESVARLSTSSPPAVVEPTNESSHPTSDDQLSASTKDELIKTDPDSMEGYIGQDSSHPVEEFPLDSESAIKYSPHPIDGSTPEAYVVGVNDEPQHTQDEPSMDVAMGNSSLPEGLEKTEPGDDYFSVPPENSFQLMEYAEDIPNQAQDYGASIGDDEVVEYQEVKEEDEMEIYQDDPTPHDLLQLREGEILHSSGELDLNLDGAYDFNHTNKVRQVDLRTEESLIQVNGQGEEHQDLSCYTSNACSGEVMLMGSELSLPGDYTMATGTENGPIHYIFVMQPQ